jgi:hypothetical protein
VSAKTRAMCAFLAWFVALVVAHKTGLIGWDAAVVLYLVLLGFAFVADALLARAARGREEQA